jgi:hypothetical protein
MDFSVRGSSPPNLDGERMRRSYHEVVTDTSMVLAMVFGLTGQGVTLEFDHGVQDLVLRWDF